MTLLQKKFGTAANDVHFQAYILEKIVWWNSQRSIAAIDSAEAKSVHLIINLDLNSSVYVRPYCWINLLTYNVISTAAYTEELFGIEYIYSEMGSNLTLRVNIDIEIEEGLNDDDDFFTKMIVLTLNWMLLSSPS